MDVDTRIGEIEFDLIEGDKSLGQIARGNRFADVGALGQWLIDQRQQQLWRDLQSYGRERGDTIPIAPVPRKAAQPKREPVRPAASTPPSEPERKDEPVEEVTSPEHEADQNWRYIQRGLASPKKRTVAKAEKIVTLTKDLIEVVDAEAEEVEALKKIKELEEQLAAEKAKIKKPAKKTDSRKDTHAVRVRRWARENNYEVPDRGRMSTEVYAAYAKAHP